MTFRERSYYTDDIDLVAIRLFETNGAEEVPEDKPSFWREFRDSKSCEALIFALFGIAAFVGACLLLDMPPQQMMEGIGL